MNGIELEAVLKAAAADKASDVHFTCGEAGFQRGPGGLARLAWQAPRDEEAFMSLFEGLLEPSEIENWRLRHEIDAGFALPGQETGFRLRLNGYWANGRPAAAIRIVRNAIPGPEECGIPKALQEICMRHDGLVLLTGPCGSGKSTTMASLVQWLAEQRPLHIVTLEDPIEYVYHSGKSLIHQRQIGKDAESFAGGVRCALREDIDLLCIGELRDCETIAAALSAAETGHLVLATLHAPDASRSVERIIDLFPPATQAHARTLLSLTLQAVSAQRLLFTGADRVAAFELMTASPAVRSAIRENKTSQLKSLIQTGARDGMTTLEAVLARLVESGRLPLAVAAENAYNESEFYSLLRRENRVR